MANERYRSGYSRSSHTVDEFSRPPSHSPSPPAGSGNSDAFAFGMATEAMRTAADAMARAADVMTSRASVGSQIPLSNIQPGLRPSSPPEIPVRRSSLDPSTTRPVHAHLQPSASFQAPMISPFTFPDRSLMGGSGSGGGKYGGTSNHMDLVEAVNYLHAPSEKGWPRYSGQSYGEDVADRNMGAFSLPSRASSLPLANASSKMSNSSVIHSRGDSHDQNHGDENDHGGHGHTMSLPREIIFIFLICMAQLLTQAALSHTIAPLPYLASTFSSSNNATSLAWYSAAFALTTGTFILPAGRFGDVYGHKTLFAIGWMWFSLSSLLCGFAPMAERAGLDGSIFFVVARALQGIGPALVMPNGLALMGTTYAPGKKKNMLFALFGACAPAGFVIGAVFSSLLAQKAEWEVGFWVMAGVCALFAVGTIVFIPSPPPAPPILRDPKRTFRTWIKETSSTLDLPGALLGVTSLLLINISLNQAPLVGWSTPYTYFLLLLGLFLVPFFLYHQSHAPSPLIPKSILNSHTAFILTATACGWASMGIWIFYIFAYLSLLPLTPLHSSLYFTPAPVAGCIASLVTGYALSRGKPQWVMLCSMAAFCTGTILISTTDPGRSYWTGVFWSILVMPFGMDMSFPSATLLVSDKAGRGSQGMAASVVNTVVNYSISVGLGLAGTVVREIGADVVEEGEVREVELLRGFRSAWWTGVGLSGVGIVVAAAFCVLCFVEDRRRKREGREKR